MARSVYMMTASLSSASTSILLLTSFMRPDCIREKSSSSSTMSERRSVSRMMTPMPVSRVAWSIFSSMSMVSPQPRMAVRGVRSSWDTEEMKSFLSFSELASSSAM